MTRTDYLGPSSPGLARCAEPSICVRNGAVNPAAAVENDHMATYEAGPLIAAAAIGAGGAVAAQIISSVVTGRRDTKRFDWERQRQERDWKIHESDRFMTHKQELYSRYLSITYDPIMDTVQLTRQEYADGPDWHQLVPEYVGPLQTEIDKLRWDIRLVGSPTVAERVEFSNASLLIAISEAGWPSRHTIERRHEFADNALRAWQQVSDAMRADLRGDDAGLRRLAEQFYSRRRITTAPEPTLPWLRRTVMRVFRRQSARTPPEPRREVARAGYIGGSGDPE